MDIGTKVKISGTKYEGEIIAFKAERHSAYTTHSTIKIAVVKLTDGRVMEYVINEIRKKD